MIDLRTEIGIILNDGLENVTPSNEILDSIMAYINPIIGLHPWGVLEIGTKVRLKDVSENLGRVGEIVTITKHVAWGNNPTGGYECSNDNTGIYLNGDFEEII